MTAGNASERLERSLPIVGHGAGAAALVQQAAVVGVRLEAKDDGRLWADAPTRLPPELRDSLTANRAAVWVFIAAAPHDPHNFGTPLTTPRARVVSIPVVWCEGVAKLEAMGVPSGIALHRWRIFQAGAARLLRDHGAALHAAGWDTLDLFGLHSLAPTTNAAGMGLAWLLGDSSVVLDVGPDVVGMRVAPGGARLAFYRRQGTRAGTVVAWKLYGDGCAGT